jgi:hypothetical protein
MPFAFLGLPSLHSIIEAIANGFFGALATALVPGFLKHGTVATIQHLVALPDHRWHWQVILPCQLRRPGLVCRQLQPTRCRSCSPSYLRPSVAPLPTA